MYYLKLFNFFIKDPEPDKSRPDPQHCLSVNECDVSGT